MFMKFVNSLKVNLVSIISLAVAVVALTYNTQRAEITEENRNIRFACFEILRQTNQLQQLVDHAHYDADLNRGNPIVGWSHVNYINDLGMVVPSTVEGKAKELLGEWQKGFTALGQMQTNDQRQQSLKANQDISRAVAELRMSVRDVLNALE